jgi:hypothetical protein
MRFPAQAGELRMVGGRILVLSRAADAGARRKSGSCGERSAITEGSRRGRRRREETGNVLLDGDKVLIDEHSLDVSGRIPTVELVDGIVSGNARGPKQLVKCRLNRPMMRSHEPVAILVVLAVLVSGVGQQGSQTLNQVNRRVESDHSGPLRVSVDVNRVQEGAIPVRLPPMLARVGHKLRWPPSP